MPASLFGRQEEKKLAKIFGFQNKLEEFWKIPKRIRILNNESFLENKFISAFVGEKD